MNHLLVNNTYYFPHIFKINNTIKLTNIQNYVILNACNRRGNFKNSRIGEK